MKRLSSLLIVLVFLAFTNHAKAGDSLKVREVGLVFSNLNSFGLCYKTGDQNTLFRITALSLTGTNTTIGYNNATYNGAPASASNSPTNTIGAGLTIGFEKRNHINERFYFYYGLAWINSYTSSKTSAATPTNYNSPGYFNTDNVYTVQSAYLNATTVNNTTTISSGLGAVVGVAYMLGRRFSIGAELVPAVTYSYSDVTTAATTYVAGWTSLGSGLGYTLDLATLNSSADKVTKGINFSVINTGAAITIAYKIK